SLQGDWGYLQTNFGSILARFLVAGLLIGIYYRARVFTVYDWLEQRFGKRTRMTATGLFLVGRSLGSGVRLYGAAIALWVVTEGQLGFDLAILLIACAAVIYTIVGGIRAVIWTDVLQGFLLAAGGVAAAIVLFQDIDMSVVDAWQKLSDSGKTRVFNWSLDPRDAYTIWAGVIGTCFLTLSTHGTDQDMVQRMLTCKDEKAGKRSVYVSAALVFPVAVLFLTVGSLLWLKFGEEGSQALAAKIAERAGEPVAKKGFDYLFCWVAVHDFPAGVKGLIVAGVFAAAMSSLDSAISALSSTAVKNVWMPHVAPGRSDAYYLKASRWFTISFGLVLAGIAYLVWSTKSAGSAKEGFGILMLGLKVLTWIFPPLLGVFLVGALTRRGSDSGNIVALAGGVGLLLAVEFMDNPPWVWAWNPVIGFAVTFALASLFPPPREAQP
ncbi:MAG: hypothetical protein KDB53_03065, partial [Planctomycetes bacterium]|nr:hypothetical protein [Planctomycetota bacterium]